MAGDCFARGRKEGIDAAPFSSVVEPAVPLDSTVSHFLVQLGKRWEEQEGGGLVGVESVFWERENERTKEREKEIKEERKEGKANEKESTNK